MAALDFTEIPAAHEGDDRDAFEMFARDFLETQGFTVIIGPDRGPDGGRDLVVEELRTGIVGETKLRWLVSCKHKAGSGASVVQGDEPDIRDRLEANDCQGFIGFYSTVPATSLSNRLELFRANTGTPYLVYDRERIESLMLESPDGLKLAERYFPTSFAGWRRENPTPSTLFSDPLPLECDYCGRDLLNPVSGVVIVWSRYDDEREGPDRREVVETYWCCKGHCDDRLKARRKQPDWIGGWKDITDLASPIGHIKWVMATLNQIHSGVRYSESAFDKQKDLLLTLYPYVSRDMTSSERKDLRYSMMLPAWAGGF